VNPRRVAYEVQSRVDHDGAYANVLLPKTLERHDRMTDRDKAFVTNLVYGTTRMRRACDFLVDRFLMKPPAPELRTLLRLGAYELHYNGTPPHAAVGETVALAPKRSAGFVNAVLRNVAAQGSDVEWPDDATRLSYPDWIVETLVRDLGPDDALAALTTMNEPPGVHRRADGYIQDPASQWVAEAVGAREGERVADLCAAPGGKSTLMAGTGAQVAASDQQRHRARLVQRNAQRIGVSIGTLVADGRSTPYADGVFDRVLVDAPCSGLGTLRRRPDARWHVDPEAPARLARLQAELLAEARRICRPGGRIVYSVCTLTVAESVAVDDAAMSDLVVVDPPPSPWDPHGRGARLSPQALSTDGMCIFRYIR
jgi:16S rRNA (cytosine967-C5)-methyltransferase